MSSACGRDLREVLEQVPDPRGRKTPARRIASRLPESAARFFKAFLPVYVDNKNLFMDLAVRRRLRLAA